MQFLHRAGNGPSAKYFNTSPAALYLDRGSPRYVGGWLVMLNERLNCCTQYKGPEGETVDLAVDRHRKERFRRVSNTFLICSVHESDTKRSFSSFIRRFGAGQRGLFLATSVVPGSIAAACLLAIDTVVTATVRQSLSGRERLPASRTRQCGKGYLSL